MGANAQYSQRFRFDSYGNILDDDMEVVVEDVVEALNQLNEEVKFLESNIEDLERGEKYCKENH